MAMEWWRCKHGAPFDPKWRSIATRCNDDATQCNTGAIRPGDVWCVFTALCDRASQADERGSLEGLDLEDIAAGLGFGLEEVELIYRTLSKRGLVKENRLSSWERHQPKREDASSTERSRAHRAAKKQAATQGNAVQRNATHGDAREEKIREEKIREERVGAREQVRAAQPKPSPKPSKSRKATRWPDNAVVPDEWLAEGEAYRESANRPPLDLRAEALKFANYWAAKSGGAATKLDWKRTWLNWCLTARGPEHGPGRKNSTASTLRELARMAAEIDGNSEADLVGE